MEVTESRLESLRSASHKERRILNELPMGEPYLALLIGAAPDLPLLFVSQPDGVEWMVAQTSRLALALNSLRRRHYQLVIAEQQPEICPASELVTVIRETQPGVKVIVIDSIPVMPI